MLLDQLTVLGYEETGKYHDVSVNAASIFRENKFGGYQWLTNRTVALPYAARCHI
jgi:hypothetical protein